MSDFQLHIPFNPTDPNDTFKEVDFEHFFEAICLGYGWIDADDVERQWHGMTGQSLTPCGLDKLKERLEKVGCLGFPRAE